jgi:small-conductance mechanosensitive channel
MKPLEIQLIETIVLLGLYIGAYATTRTWINNTLKSTQIHRGRRKMTLKAINLFTTLTTLVLLAAIWGLKQHEIAVFASSILTVLGIAFFAQWSLLSNITSGIILFFNHPLKIGDHIKVM